MKKFIFVMMLSIGILSFAGQAGIEEYRYSQGNSSFVGIDKAKGESLPIKGQAGIIEYSYTQNYSTLIATDDLLNRATRANNLFDQKYITGQPGYAVYNYIQGRNSIK